MIMNLDIPDKLKERLEQRAKKLGTSMSFIIKESIDRYLKENE